MNDYLLNNEILQLFASINETNLDNLDISLDDFRQNEREKKKEEEEEEEEESNFILKTKEEERRKQNGTKLSSTQADSFLQIRRPEQFLSSLKEKTVTYLSIKRNRTPGDKGTCLRTENIQKKLVVGLFRSIYSAINLILKDKTIFPFGMMKKELKKGTKLKELLPLDISISCKDIILEHSTFFECTEIEYYYKVFIEGKNILGVDMNDFQQNVLTLEEILKKAQNKCNGYTPEYIEKIRNTAKDFIFKL